MRILKIMPDYYCHPIWEASPGVVGNVNPKNLPISEDLQEKFFEWAKKFDSILDIENPRASGFKTSDEKNEFLATGNNLADMLRQELGESYEVICKIG